MQAAANNWGRDNGQFDTMQNIMSGENYNLMSTDYLTRVQNLMNMQADSEHKTNAMPDSVYDAATRIVNGDVSQKDADEVRGYLAKFGVNTDDDQALFLGANSIVSGYGYQTDTEKMYRAMAGNIQNELNWRQAASDKLAKYSLDGAYIYIDGVYDPAVVGADHDRQISKLESEKLQAQNTPGVVTDDVYDAAERIWNGEGTTEDDTKIRLFMNQVGMSADDGYGPNYVAELIMSDYFEADTSSIDRSIASEEKARELNSGIDLYDYINGKVSDELWMADAQAAIGGANGPTADWATKGYNLLTQEERLKFNTYYKLYGAEAGQAYLDSMQHELNMRYTNVINSRASLMAGIPVFGSAFSVATNLASGANAFSQGIIRIAEAMGIDTGRLDEINDPYSRFYAGTNFTNALRTKKTEEFGDYAANLLGEDWRWLGRVIYQVGMSAADSLASSMFGRFMGVGLGGTEALGEALGLLAMSGTATQSSMNERLMNGDDPTHAFFFAAIDGAVEYFTEKLPLETAFSDPQYAGFKDLLATMSITSAEEGTEEMIGSVVREVLKFAFDAESYEQEYLTELARDPNTTRDRWAAQYVLNFVRDVGVDGLMGAASGLLMGLGGQAARSAQSAANSR